MEKIEINIENKISELEKIFSYVEKISNKWSFSEEVVFEINLILEEYIVNLISYGYGDDEIHLVKISCHFNEGILIIEVTDDSKSYDITQVDRNTSKEASDENVKIGGWGITLIKNMVESIEYKKENDFNTITLIKKII